MGRKNPKFDQRTFDALRQARAIPKGYYSGDQPNPNLRRFVEENATAYDPAADRYNVAAFNQPIETTKATAMYNMHVYWSKKPHTAIRQYIGHYTQPGDLVLDPFCGSGGTALAALLEGRKAIAIDRSPAATFITKNHCTPVDPDCAARSLRPRPPRGAARDRLALRDPLRPLRRQGHDRIHGLQPGLPVPTVLEENPSIRLRYRGFRDRLWQSQERECLPVLPG